MGIPYSKQINSAFDQVTPLVAAGFEVLQTTKNISILLAAIQVLTAVLLAFILATLVALLITMNPDLEKERRTIVSPVMKWFTCWLMPDCATRTGVIMAVVWFSVAILVFAGALGFFSHSTNVEKTAPEGSGSPDGEDAGAVDDSEKPDDSKKGKSKG